MAERALWIVLAVLLLGAGEARAATLTEHGLPAEDEMVGWIEKLCEGPHRRPGTIEDHRAAYYIAQKFIEFGLEDVQIEPIPLDVWTAAKWELKLDAQGELRTLPCFYMPYTGFTGPKGIRAELVYVGKGSAADYDEKDVRDKVVAVDLALPTVDVDRLRSYAFHVQDVRNTIPQGYRMPAQAAIPNLEGSYVRAVQNGAAGYIGILTNMPGDQYEFYFKYDGKMKPLPALYVGRGGGETIRALANSGPVRAHVVLDGEIVPGLTENVVGVAPGRSEEAILLTCHHDAPFVGAVEDASGIAALMAVAQWAAQQNGESRQRTWVFLASAGHFYGGIGRQAFMRRHKDDILARTVAGLSVEHIAREYTEKDGKIAPTGYLEISVIWVVDRPMLKDVVINAVKKFDVERTVVLPAETPMFPRPIGEITPYFLRGLPTVNYISGPVYLLNADDTLEKVDTKMLVPVASAFVEIMNGIDSLAAASLSAQTGEGRRTWVSGQVREEVGQ